MTLAGHLSGPVCRLSGSSLGWSRQAAGSNTGNSTGEGEKNAGGMNWCRSVSGQEEAITRSFKGPLICKQNAVVLHKIEAEWKGMLGKHLHGTF